VVRAGLIRAVWGWRINGPWGMAINDLGAGAQLSPPDLAVFEVPFREPPDPHFDYRLLVKAATAAKRMGAVVPYSQSLFRAVWVESVWPLDEDVCRQAATSVGLSSSEFGEVLLEPATDDELRSTAAEAHRRGPFGVPTLFVGDRMFWGNDRLVLGRHLLMTRTRSHRRSAFLVAAAPAAARRSRWASSPSR